MNLTRLYDFWHQKLLRFLFSHTTYKNNYYDLNFSKTDSSTNNKSLFFNNKDFFEAIFLIISWLKARFLYYLNNWVYTTNHKRIAINYFWFVILSGVVGMVLATIIRLELAYPGTGIFAGDSLQYLSLVTAHGVVMVFFMIMPLLFGAFANFLLPTQLGVHDVAFPRLNSAAFWFLPSGLIMLAQLICVDRRYQRMNCFNIREVQALLKRKFFADLVNSNDYRNFLNDTMVGARYRIHGTSVIDHNFLVFYNYGTNLNPKSRFAPLRPSFSKTNPYTNTSIGSFFFNNIDNAKKNKPLSFATDFYLAITKYYQSTALVIWDTFKDSSDSVMVSSAGSLNFFKNKKNSNLLHIDSFRSPLFAVNFFLTSFHHFFLASEEVLIRLQIETLDVFHHLIKSPLLVYAHKNIEFQMHLVPISFSEFFWVKNYKLPLTWTDTYLHNLFFNVETANEFIKSFWLSILDYPSSFGMHYLTITVRLEIFLKTLDLYFYNFSSIATFAAKNTLHRIEYPLIKIFKILIKPLQTIGEYYHRFEEFYMWYQLKHFKEGITLKEVMVDKFYKKLNEIGDFRHLENTNLFSNYLWEQALFAFSLNLGPIDAKIFQSATFDHLDKNKLKWADVWAELSNEINEGVRCYLTDKVLNDFISALKFATIGEMPNWLPFLNEIRWFVVNLIIFIKNSVISSPHPKSLIFFYDPLSDTYYFFSPCSFHFFFFKNLHIYDIYHPEPFSWETVHEAETFVRANGGVLNVLYNFFVSTLNLFKSITTAFFDIFCYGILITLSNTITSWLTLQTIPVTLDRDFFYVYDKKFKAMFAFFWEYVSVPFYPVPTTIAFFWIELLSLPFHLIGFYQTFNIRTFFFFFEDFFLHNGEYVFYANFFNFTNFNAIISFIKNLKTLTTSLIFNSRVGDLFFSIPQFVKSFHVLFFERTFPFFWFLNSNLLFESDYFSFSNVKITNLLDNVEKTTENRHHESQAPIFKYDYKAGDYFPKLYKEVYTHLFTTVSTLTGGFRQSPWFSSTSYLELFNDDAVTAISNIKKTFNFWKTIHHWTPIRVNGTASFYNFFFNLLSNDMFYNLRWVSKNVLNQKFYRMFNTSSVQQRVYTNWRNLKFTREAWRCKLLSAHHQKTLFRRYVSEDNVFWSIERNARDLLPGWAMITPFSSRTRFTAIGKVDIGLFAVLLVLNSSLISSANFLITYRYLSTLNNRKMRDARSFFTEAVMVTSWMMIAANPMLVIGIIMLLSDRHWQTSFFDYSGGGDTVLFQHMFWFFGHPEVYIIIIPVFGFTNTILSYYLKKRISARTSLLYSMYTIAFLGFFVWGHHMYMVGLSHTTRMLFSTLTVMISVPAATKLMHWCVTIVNSAITLELPLICILTFIFFFISGGISGMFVAHTGMDVLFHDTFYVIGHFHVMLAGAAMIGCFGAFYFYFPAIFGVKYNRIYAYLHYIYYLLGQLFTLIPMFWLGYAGMPRRVLDYPTSFGGWHSLISGGHMLSVAGMLAFFLMIFDSMRQGKAATRVTFGVGRYNTRLNFYIYETARLMYVQQKGWSFYRRFHYKSLKLNALHYTNLENLETVSYSYVFTKTPLVDKTK